MSVSVLSNSSTVDDESEEIISSESNIQEEINFIETNAEYVSNDLVSRFEDFTGEKLYDGDERKIFLQGFSYILTDTLIHINQTGRENLLEYATGSNLDALGELYGNERLEATNANTCLVFYISSTPTSNITIPEGTRVTSDGERFFATDKQIIFEAGTDILSQSVTATATDTGVDYNGILAGEIDKIVDGVAYVTGVENTTSTSGGSDLESDDEYKERLKLSPFSFSVAGPSNAYKMIALSTSNQVGDVSVYSPSAGVVEIAVVKDGGAIPSASDEILSLILEACDDKNRRPLTDKVQVVPATASPMEINVKYYVANNDTSKISDITLAVEEYKTWQTEKIGRDINPDKLINLMMNAGAARVEIIAPVFTELEYNQIAQITNTNVVYSGSVTI